MKEKLVSIIVPVYKTKPYLERCVQSVIKQTYTYWEMLLIDDGSPDDSGALCDELANRDNRIRAIHKKNGGVSSARNLGITESKGEWIMFLDSDDFFKDEDYVEKLVNCAKDADIVISGCSYYYENNKQYKPKKITGETIYIADKAYNAYVNKCLNRSDFLVVWAKLFKRQIIQEHHILFNENMVVTEDALFLHTYLLNSNSLCASNTQGYSFFMKNGKPKYNLSSQQAELHINNIISDLRNLQDQRGIHNQTFNDYIPTYYLRLYTKYIWSNKLWCKESIQNMKRITNNPAVMNTLQKNFFIKVLYHILPIRLKLLVQDFQVRYRFKYKPSIY